MATELDLSECGLEDEDVTELMDLVNSYPLLTSLNIRYVAKHGKSRSVFKLSAFGKPSGGHGLCQTRVGELGHSVKNNAVS